MTSKGALLSKKVQFHGSELVITNHAVERLRERWRESGRGDLNRGAALALLERLLADAKPTRLRSAKLVSRIINNGFKPAEYWASSGMRFVIVTDDEVRALVTVERNTS